MEIKELRKKYLDFFEKKGHKIISSAPLIPQNDSTTLFISAGMQPLIPYLLGLKHPKWPRLVGIQKCLRTGDIEEVGDEIHHTFFEMLGNWSLGDYFRMEAINLSFEFLTSAEWLNIPKEKLAISVFAGDKNATFDNESYNLWQRLGISQARIAKLSKENNWWGPIGQSGPCGPDTEIFYWASSKQPPVEFDLNNPSWVEIWNNVFMEYNQREDGSFDHLKQKNVDTGMGVERALAVLEGHYDDYQTELFQPIIQKLTQQIGKDYEENTKFFRIIADHLKAATFLIKEGVLPSNKHQGYILRRLIRRAAVKINQLKEGSMDSLAELADPVLEIYADTNYFQTSDRDQIKEVIGEEVKRFHRTLKLGLKELDKYISTAGKNMLSASDIFRLYESFGLPYELLKEIGEGRGIGLPSKDEFDKEFERHQVQSRTTSAGIFKGGLSQRSKQTTKLHTATHLLQAAAKQILGVAVGQKGSHITPDRLRWDFNYGKKLSDQQLKQIEDLVNQKIQEDLLVYFDIEDKEDAIKNGAIFNQGENYPDKVKVYKINGFSKELCGGPHVLRTGVLKKFKIIKEETISSGIRRIYAQLI